MPYIDEILIEKYRVQTEIAKENQYDLHKINESAHQNIQKLAQQFNTKLKYWNSTKKETVEPALLYNH